MSRRGHRPLRWSVIRAIVAKDLIAVRRSKAVVIPMMAVPFQADSHADAPESPPEARG